MVRVLWIAPAIVAVAGMGCATVSAPVLRHQTGETLGQKRFRIFGHFEKSRVFAPSTTAETLGVDQEGSVFQGSFLGVEADGGVLPKLDLQLGANFTTGGGGWRVGAKYQVWRDGRFAIAAMTGYAAMSGSGTLTYSTTGTTAEIEQTLSAHTFDLSIPASARLASFLVFYGGPIWLRSGVSGSFGGSVVEDTSNDFGLNFGAQVAHGIFVGDIEIAELMVYDPFSSGRRFIPYFGLSFGVVF